jgi:hypothetical protein
MLVATQATSSVSVEYYTTYVAVEASARSLRVQDVSASFTIVAAAIAVAVQLALLLASTYSEAITATELLCWLSCCCTNLCRLHLLIGDLLVDLTQFECNKCL